jgi:hypothetical protein
MTAQTLAERIAGERRRLAETLAAPRRAQQRVLADVLAANAATDFGTEHGLPRVSDLDEFRRAVPIRTHEQLMPWIERTIAGEGKVLTADHPVVYFSSSGTTGREKHIPVTRTFMRTTFLAFYYAGFARVLEHHPDLLGDEGAVLNLWQDPTALTGRTAGGQPHLGPSQVDYRRFGEQLAVGPGNNAPWSRVLDEYADAGLWERAYLRLRLAAERDIRWVIAVNPAILAALPYQLDAWWPRIVAELRDGTLGGRPYGEPRRERARRIEELAGYRGTLLPADLWPNLKLIISWNTALSSLYLPRVRERFGPDVSVLSPPIASCEGPVAVPLDRHPSAGPLFLPGCLYEFIPAERDIGPDAETLLADEIEPGRDYHVVLTHVGGLYRCATNDTVRVVGRVRRTPTVEYAGRSGTLSAAGERLREPEMVRALAAALGDVGLRVRNATARLAEAGGTGGAGRGYEVAAALTDAPTGAEVAAFGAALDRRLAEQSAGYRAARAAGTLDPVRVVPTHPDAFLREFERRVRAGERPPRVKDRVFQPDPAVWDRLTAEPAQAPPEPGPAIEDRLTVGSGR